MYQSLKVNFAIKGIVDHLLPLGHTYDTTAIAAAEAQVAGPGGGGAAYAGGGYMGQGPYYGGGTGATYLYY
jgi:hypothetical protein